MRTRTYIVALAGVGGLASFARLVAQSTGSSQQPCYYVDEERCPAWATNALGRPCYLDPPSQWRPKVIPATATGWVQHVAAQFPSCNYLCPGELLARPLGDQGRVPDTTSATCSVARATNSLR